VVCRATRWRNGVVERAPPRGELRCSTDGRGGAILVVVEPTDLTVRILQEIRDDIRGSREEQRGLREEQRGLREEQRAAREAADVRFEAIETALRDMAQQLVILGRGIKVALERRSSTDDRLDDHERRLAEVEKRFAP